MSDHVMQSPAGTAPAQAGQGLPVQASAPAPANLGAWFNVTEPAYLRGMLLGAGVALAVTNPRVKKAVISGTVRLWSAIQGGVEEIKEQIQDAKAELSREG